MTDKINPYDDDDIQSNSDSDIRSVNEGSNDIRWEHSNLQVDKDSEETE
ncbi:hypothetical protein PAECIP111893_01595 [Paenibacillus plantiphilus]|uniref:DUF4025 domain-containing protein n=1 Tax=Paenibacillus plantiphilus TaxID=2905650 RepID=A0ABN8GB86_9BACL|nr:hypothetical protein [Paenibacillus plantiphilus]CAH1201384.1 hypothetical protein PAECIP111893_01595 [Paenibacillus plantiphilus]